MKPLGILAAVLAAAAWLVVAVGVYAGIWLDDDRWYSTAFFSFYVALPFSGIAAYLLSDGERP